jgi:hypothetical protein
VLQGQAWQGGEGVQQQNSQDTLHKLGEPPELQPQCQVSGWLTSLSTSGVSHGDKSKFSQSAECHLTLTGVQSLHTPGDTSLLSGAVLTSVMLTLTGHPAVSSWLNMLVSP